MKRPSSPRRLRWLLTVLPMAGCISITTARSAPPPTSPPAQPPPQQPTTPAGPLGWTRKFPEPSRTIDVDVQETPTGLSITAQDLGPLVKPTGAKLYKDEGQLQVSAAVTPALNGFDIRYTITNPTQQLQNLPALQVDGHQLPEKLSWMHFRFGTYFEDLVWTPGVMKVSADNPYPGIMYAPVCVVKDSRLALGVALQYPLMQYQHTVRVFVWRAPNYDRWVSCVRLDGQIEPGATRTYTTSHRYAAPEDWIHTLAPYRSFLHATYGSRPKYIQDLRPVFGRFLSYPEHTSADNPRGFLAQTRPDLKGWKGEVDMVLGQCQKDGFERSMFWMAMGAYRVHRKNNFPPGMMEYWSEPMKRTVSEFDRIKEAGIELGFWWGRSFEIASPEQWDPPEIIHIDPTSSVHMATLKKEFALAAQRGVERVGLDSFRYVKPWIAIPWLAEMRGIWPRMTFVGEPVSNDVMHIQIPQFTDGPNCPTPPLLADYLVPGREIWILLLEDHSNMKRAREAISQGLTVVTFSKTMPAREMETALKAARRGS